MAIEILPSGRALGAEIRGINLAAPIGDDTFDAIREAWSDHLVLLFRGQSLSDDDLIRFSQRFGALDIAPASATDMAGAQEKSRPEIWIISNVVENGKPIGALGDKEAEWHTDMSYVDEPPMASVLHSLEIPKAGGDTSFANMYKALETLPADLRRAIEGRVCNHDASTTSVGELRAGAGAVTDVRLAPGAKHPMIRTHPVTGGKALYLGRRLNAYIPALNSKRASGCSTRSGLTARSPNSSGRINGASAISLSGITAPPSTAATVSAARNAGSCIARRSRAIGRGELVRLSATSVSLALTNLRPRPVIAATKLNIWRKSHADFRVAGCGRHRKSEAGGA